MNKGLDALHTMINNGYIKSSVKELDIIEKELKRLEELETMYSNCVIKGARQKRGKR